VKVIEADSAYIMSDNDSKIDARRIAMQEVKRKALELAGTYVESLTEVKNYELTKDEVKTYTAGVMEAEVMSEQMRGTTEHPEIYIRAHCKIDTDVLMKLIDHYRDNEDLKEQLEASAKENEDLRKERGALVRQLAAEKDKAKAEETRKKLDTVLAKEETNDDTTRVWTNLAYKFGEGDENGHEIKQAELDNSTVVLERAIKVNPQNQRARSLLAAIYQRKGDYAAAESELRAVIQRNPSNPIPHMRLGILLRERGRHEEALKEFHFVERLRPHNPMMLFYTGMTFKDMKRCGRAVQYLQKFLKDKRANKFPKYQERAIQTIEACGESGGHQRRVRQN
jgi:predicted Zn-dependent protease